MAPLPQHRYNNTTPPSISSSAITNIIPSLPVIYSRTYDEVWRCNNNEY
jgi:hypothetical protein